MKTMRGFTIAEVTIVIGLLGILVLLGSFLSAPYLRDQYLRAAGETVLAELRRAQMDALTQSDDLAHGIKVFPGSVVRFAGNSYAWRDPSFDVVTAFSAEATIPAGDEIAIPKGSSGPSTTTTISLEQNALGIDITLTPYGVLTVEERTISD